jgi:hypothetical protein
MPDTLLGMDADTKARAERAREVRLRRHAKQQGLRLEKSRTRYPRALDYGTYWLINTADGSVECGDTVNGYGMSLDEIEAALNEGPPR